MQLQCKKVRDNRFYDFVRVHYDISRKLQLALRTQILLQKRPKLVFRQHRGMTVKFGTTFRRHIRNILNLILLYPSIIFVNKY